jgi:thiamine biosynthesis lipoprotein
MIFDMNRHEDAWVAHFEAMAGPCEVHVCVDSRSEARALASLVVDEAIRIERKYSRYRDDSITHEINSSNGQSVKIDSETERLLRFAAQCFEISEGSFDITSGVLRRAWRFDGQKAEPDEGLIRKLLQKVGWNRVVLGSHFVQLEPGMEIDFGGIGKEYAVDRSIEILAENTSSAFLVNFGGDIRVLSPKSKPRTWSIGIENPDSENSPVGQIELSNGAVATSGDLRRFCLYGGKRLCHILDATTGWPVQNAPRSVTVVCSNCLEAGFVATLAMLHGPKAEDFLNAQGLTHHCIR